MKKLLFVTALIASSLLSQSTYAQDAKPKAAPASPAASVSETIASGNLVSINYCQPGVKGRTIGKDLEPMDGKVWRTGANDATVFEISKDATIEGQQLPAGKYALFTLVNGKEWTIIFNKTFKQWGAYQYKEAEDALRVKVNAGKAPQFAERMTFQINKSGKVSLLWGDREVDFMVK